MRQGRWGRVRLAVLAASVALTLTACSTHDAEKKLRFGWPTGVTKQAERMRVLWTWAGVAALIVGVLVWGLIFWACIRYRKKSDELPRQTKYNLPIEIAYSIVPFLIIAPLFVATYQTENYVDKTTAHPNVTVEVEAFKWNWKFDYLNANGADLKASDGGLLSTVGSSDEIPILVLPVDQSIRFVEHSDDVIHSFWVPEFLFKRDVIPYGTTATTHDNQFQINTTTVGSYVGRCAELCGTYHSQMNFEVRVLPTDQFQAYLAALLKLDPADPARQHEALSAIGQTPYATTTHPFNTDRTTRSASK